MQIDGERAVIEESPIVEKKTEVVLMRIERKTGLLMLGVVVAAFAVPAIAEHLTMTASYPAPSGIYNQLITTGGSAASPVDSTFSRVAGNVVLVPATNVAGRVGIGTSSPASKLHVAGGVQMGDDPADCAPDKAGALRYRAGALQACDGSDWRSAGGGAPTTTVVTGPSSVCRGASTADCPTGSFVVGGGFHWMSTCGCDEEYRFPTISRPTANGWTSTIECSTNRAYAVCMRF